MRDNEQPVTSLKITLPNSPQLGDVIITPDGRWIEIPALRSESACSESQGTAGRSGVSEMRDNEQPDEYTAFQSALKSWGAPDDEFNQYHADEGALYWLWGKAVAWATKRESRELPVVRLNSYAPKLPDECEVEVFLNEDRINHMRPVKGGFMVKILALNPQPQSRKS